MINNPSPEGSGTEWNSDNIAIGNLSCKELAALSTAFYGAFRIINSEKKAGGAHGVLLAMHNLLEHHIALMSSDELPESFKKSADNVTSVTLVAFCLAVISSLEKLDPHRSGVLASTLLKSLVELTKETGPVGPDDVVLVDARVNGRQDEDDDLSAVELAIRLESAIKLDAFADNIEIGKLIKKIVGAKEDKNDGGIHGAN